MKITLNSKGMLRKVIFLLVVCLVLLMLPASFIFAQTVVPVYNPGFELPVKAGSIPGWTQTFGLGGVNVESSIKYSGIYSVKLNDTNPSDSLGIESDKIFITSEETYKASAMVYIETNSAEIYLRFWDANDNYLGCSHQQVASPLNQWTPISVTGTAPSGAAKASILLYSSVARVSSVYYDDIGLSRVNPVTNSGYETSLTGWTQTFGSGGVTIESSIKHSGSYSVKLDDTNPSDSLGIESDKITIVEGESYKASAMAYIETNSAEIYLRFWDANDNYLGCSHQQVASPFNQWTLISVTGIAPSGAAKASILLYSSVARVSSVYYDDITFECAFTDLGTQVTGITIMEACYGIGLNGEPLMYTVIAGEPAKFNVINAKTEEVLRTIEIIGEGGAWALVTASDGKVYVGTYPNGKIYCYDHTSGTFDDLGVAISGQTMILDMTPGLNGKVFGSSYNGCYTFEIDSGVITQFGGSMVQGEEYSRSIVYDSQYDNLYVGVGAHAHLIKYDFSTGTKTDILPSQYSNEEFVYDIQLEGGKIF